MGLDQGFADKQIVSESAKETADNWSYDGWQPDARPIGQAVIFESRDHRKQTWTQIACWIDGISVHSSKRDTDGYHEQPDDDGRQIRTRKRVKLVDNGENQANQKGGPHDLIKKARPKPWNRW